MDRYATMLDELDRKVAAGQADLTGETAEAELLFGPGRARGVACGGSRSRREGPPRQGLVGRARSRRRAGAGAFRRLVRALPAVVGRRSRGFKGVEKALPQLAELGFDVVYLPPVHPIGTTNRKGKNNALVAKPDDPGSPWAIGASRGRPRRDQSRPRHGQGLRPARRGRAQARRRDRARLRDPVLARPPVAPAAPGVVQPPAGRDAQVRGEPAQALPGHLQRQLRLRGLARASGMRCGTSSCTGAAAASAPTASTTRTRSRCRSGSG